MVLCWSFEGPLSEHLWPQIWIENIQRLKLSDEVYSTRMAQCTPSIAAEVARQGRTTGVEDLMLIFACMTITWAYLTVNSLESFPGVLGVRDFETIPPCSDGKFLGFQKPVADMNVVLPTTALVCCISNLRQPSNQKPKREGQWLDNKGMTLHIRWRCGFSLPRHL